MYTLFILILSTLLTATTNNIHNLGIKLSHKATIYNAENICPMILEVQNFQPGHLNYTVDNLHCETLPETSPADVTVKSVCFLLNQFFDRSNKQLNQSFESLLAFVQNRDLFTAQSPSEVDKTKRSLTKKILGIVLEKLAGQTVDTAYSLLLKKFIGTDSRITNRLQNSLNKIMKAMEQQQQLIALVQKGQDSEKIISFLLASAVETLFHSLTANSVLQNIQFQEIVQSNFYQSVFQENLLPSSVNYTHLSTSYQEFLSELDKLDLRSALKLQEVITHMKVKPITRNATHSRVALQVPCQNQAEFTKLHLYKFESLPIPVETTDYNKDWSQIQVPQYVVTTENELYYSLIQLENCEKTSQQHYICDQFLIWNPIRVSDLDCITAVLMSQEEHIPKLCEISYFQSSKEATYVMKLSQGNFLISSNENDEKWNLQCPKILQKSIPVCGFCQIHLAKNCRLLTKNYVITSFDNGDAKATSVHPIATVPFSFWSNHTHIQDMIQKKLSSETYNFKTLQKETQNKATNIYLDAYTEAQSSLTVTDFKDNDYFLTIVTIGALFGAFSFPMNVYLYYRICILSAIITRVEAAPLDCQLVLSEKLQFIVFLIIAYISKKLIECVIRLINHAVQFGKCTAYSSKQKYLYLHCFTPFKETNLRICPLVCPIRNYILERDNPVESVQVQHGRLEFFVTINWIENSLKLTNQNKYVNLPRLICVNKLFSAKCSEILCDGSTQFSLYIKENNTFWKIPVLPILHTFAEGIVEEPCTSQVTTMEVEILEKET